MNWTLHFLWTDILSNILSWICSHFYEIHPYLFVYTLYRDQRRFFFIFVCYFVLCIWTSHDPSNLSKQCTWFLVSRCLLLIFLFSIFWFILLKVNTFTKPIPYSKDWFISEMIFFLFTIYIGIFIQSINIFL